MLGSEDARTSQSQLLVSVGFVTPSQYARSWRKNLAWTMGKEGRHTVVVERKLIGGSCPNIACMPSKNFIHSAKVAQLVGRGAEFGITTENVTIDMTGVRARKRRMVEGDVRLHLDLYKASGAELIMGEAHFVAPKTVEVRTNERAVRVLAGEQVVLNVGTHAAVPDLPGLKAAKQSGGLGAEWPC